MKNPVFKKLATLAAIVILLMLGLMRIESVVRDRSLHRNRATHSVAQSLAGPQTLLGPLLHMACVESWDVLETQGTERKLTERRQERTHTLVPSELKFAGEALPQTLRRGLYPVQTYLLKGNIQARWNDLSALRPAPTEKNSRMQCGTPIVMLAVSDTRGLRGVQLLHNGLAQPLKAGTFHPVYSRGLHAALPVDATPAGTPLQLELQLELAGTEQVALVPLGEHTDVHLRSSWPHPSFGGQFLPTEREVRPGGFDASWRLSALATTAAQDVLASKPLCAPNWREESDANGDGMGSNEPANCVQSIRVRLMDPINPYTLADRATKYGVLFVVLTFVAVGMVELLQRRPVHPVQYLLVGCALSAFFLLLLSLSEHLAFAYAYALASAACIVLLTYYAIHMLGHWLRGMLLGAGIALLYGVLFVLLRLEQTALVVGSVALFAVLAAIMVLTRKVNWYGLQNSTEIRV